MVNGRVCFKKPSVLSEFDKSAEDTIMLSTCLAKVSNTVEDAALVAALGFCVISDQLIFGAAPENHFSIFSANSGFSFTHCSFISFLFFTISSNSLALFVYNA